MRRPSSDGVANLPPSEHSRVGTLMKDPDLVPLAAWIMWEAFFDEPEPTQPAASRSPSRQGLAPWGGHLARAGVQGYPERMRVRCSRCGSYDVHRRWPTRFFDHLVGFLCWRPFVCWTCMGRFRAFVPPFARTP